MMGGVAREAVKQLIIHVKHLRAKVKTYYITAQTDWLERQVKQHCKKGRERGYIIFFVLTFLKFMV